MLNRFAEQLSHGLILLAAVVVLLLQGCSISQPKPQVADTAAPEEQPIPEALTAAYQQGLELLQDKKYDEALVHWQGLTQEYSQFPGCWSNLGIAQFENQSYEDSVKSFDQALSIDSSFCPALKMKALAEREAGHFKKSEETYLSALQCAPGDADVHYNLGILYDLYMQDLAKALEHYQQAAALMSQTDETLAMWITDLERRNAEQMAGDDS